VLVGGLCVAPDVCACPHWYSKWRDGRGLPVFRKPNGDPMVSHVATRPLRQLFLSSHVKHGGSTCRTLAMSALTAMFPCVPKRSSGFSTRITSRKPSSCKPARTLATRLLETAFIRQGQPPLAQSLFAADPVLPLLSSAAWIRFAPLSTRTRVSEVFCNLVVWYQGSYLQPWSNSESIEPLSIDSPGRYVKSNFPNYIKVLPFAA
jgi:hypothetical protein